MSSCSDDERAQELEVLESIYAEKYEYDAKQKQFSVTLQAEEDEDDRETRAKIEFDVAVLPNFGLKIYFSHTEGYPDEGIQYSLEHVGTIDEDDEDDDEAHISKEKLPDPFWFSDLRSMIDEIIEENLGAVMAFTICTEVQEKITELCETLNKERSDKIAQLREEEEERHTKKLVGTPVTLETFTEWKIKFQLEMKALQSDAQNKLEAELAGRPTGKHIFLNKIGKLEDDDLDVGAFIEEKDRVEVDENLFDDDLDGLEDELADLDAELEACD